MAGIKPTTSGFLVRFVATGPRQELGNAILVNIKSPHVLESVSGLSLHIQCHIIFIIPILRYVLISHKVSPSPFFHIFPVFSHRFAFFFFFWLRLVHVEVPRPATEAMSLKSPEPLQ